MIHPRSKQGSRDSCICWPGSPPLLASSMSPALWSCRETQPRSSRRAFTDPGALPEAVLYLKRQLGL